MKTVTIPEGKRLEQPIRLETVLKGGVVTEELLIVAQEGSSAEVECLVTGTAEHYTRNIEVITENGATLTMTTATSVSSGTNVHEHQKCTQKGYSRVYWFEGQFGGNKVAVTAETVLDEPGAKYERACLHAASQGAFISRENILHQASHTTSDLQARTILSGKGRAEQIGAIHVHEQAPKAHAQERMQTVILSDQAKAKAEPILQIANEDVNVSHAASVGRPKEEDLFYLQSRGYTKEQAEIELAQATCAPLLKRMPNQMLAAWMADHIAKHL